ncbi:MAG: hypothetical protein IPP37_20340 [Saprospiraceae bacterium]|nr:hypothetical protein [Saprospiraceae bacterium]
MKPTDLMGEHRTGVFDSIYDEIFERWTEDEANKGYVLAESFVTEDGVYG